MPETPYCGLAVVPPLVVEELRDPLPGLGAAPELFGGVACPVVPAGAPPGVPVVALLGVVDELLPDVPVELPPEFIFPPVAVEPPVPIEPLLPVPPAPPVLPPPAPPAPPAPPPPA